LVEREEELIDHMEEMMQYFIDLLQVTGGDLGPEKCAWFLIASGGKMEKKKWYRSRNVTKA
jgi:hypothetical protein